MAASNNIVGLQNNNNNGGLGNIQNVIDNINQQVENIHAVINNNLNNTWNDNNNDNNNDINLIKRQLRAISALCKNKIILGGLPGLENEIANYSTEEKISLLYGAILDLTRNIKETGNFEDLNREVLSHPTYAHIENRTVKKLITEMKEIDKSHLRKVGAIFVNRMFSTYDPKKMSLGGAVTLAGLVSDLLTAQKNEDTSEAFSGLGIAIAIVVIANIIFSIVDYKFPASNQ
ncbi:hypothetical protein [Candidatus Neptunochlamydia vexilliferae]|uniref:Uncharacterized protein n=1 Tax=Candidatus Neptunichlamydia vexilliferae TaxID=1651774 RepID=A0ABS0AZS8_9BACT|nr:hypothetical protein [Candidatus Neptunochlamydia vexilliferae]MBF5059651.1 hypothetical protein [Candidatus Neptunochlamydia vexilliferae]